MKTLMLYISFLFFAVSAAAQNRYELNNGWFCKKMSEVREEGVQLSRASTSIKNWLPATVPGTVLTSLLNNKLVPDPFYGMNNERIPDIYFTGNEFYTYWFVKDFKEKANADEQVWLQMRGVNYKAEVYLNGKKVNQTQHEGMLLRQQYNITSLLSKDGNNRLAILVYPPDHPGNPNGGQGGDGTIAKDLTTQYTAGWDWIQPMRDRNTGIWDKVTIEKTKGINIGNPHVVTIVPGKRLPQGKQAPAFIHVSAELENPTSKPITGILKYQLQGKTVQQKTIVPPHSVIELSLPQFSVTDPQLWWPNGYGKQNLYTATLQFVTAANSVTDEELLQFGIRQIDNKWNEHTKSMQTFVNGQPIFIKGGNWIISDAMLRFSEERYNAEIRFHRDMNLNLIRIWGGALTERPEFYAACDKYGLLVFQDFWFSGDCNGRWKDPMKKEDQWMRRKYPDNHQLVLKTAADQIKLIRNHPSLAFWCGGNEITPPDDILIPLKDSLLPKLDGTRYFFDYSNSDSMSYNSIGGNGDGPYTIQDDKTFWTVKTFPYNSEVGSVGVGDYASLVRFIPKENLIAPQVSGKADSVWEYHRYIPYNQYTEFYGATTSARDFAMKAQLVNYNQYRSLMEGFSSHMWDWYTGTIIWKTQNPWTALRGQMYDYYLDVNACLYGLRTGSKPLHIMMNPADQMVMLVNNGFQRERNLMIEVKVLDVITGKDSLYTLLFNEVGPSVSQKLFSIAGFLSSLKKKDGVFVLLRLKKDDQSIVDENFYWLPGADGNYIALQQMPSSHLSVSAVKKANGTIEVELYNKNDQPVAFFNRIALLNKETGERVLPAFFSDNYVSVMPGETKKIVIEYPVSKEQSKMLVQVYGWNVPETEIEIK